MSEPLGAIELVIDGEAVRAPAGTNLAAPFAPMRFEHEVHAHA